MENKRKTIISQELCNSRALIRRYNKDELMLSLKRIKNEYRKNYIDLEKHKNNKKKQIKYLRKEKELTRKETRIMEELGIGRLWHE